MMQLIDSILAYYPRFSLGAEPMAIPCELSIVEANGKRYLKTPFTMLDAYDGDDHKRQIENGHFYATAPECEAYLAAEYPHWQLAAPIMDTLCSNAQSRGKFVAEGQLADKLGVSIFNGALYKLARGHKSYSVKQIKAALKAL
jgi:hypothetical protein